MSQCHPVKNHGLACSVLKSPESFQGWPWYDFYDAPFLETPCARDQSTLFSYIVTTYLLAPKPVLRTIEIQFEQKSAEIIREQKVIEDSLVNY